MNKQLLLIILLILQSLSVFIPTSIATEYIIDGDKVYIDDEFVYLSVEPHTITEDTDVVFELISKQFTGEIDVAFGINNTNMKVKNPRLWNGTAWNPLNKKIQVVNVVHQGYNKWYLLKNVNVNEDVLYKLKLTVDVVFNTSGKYFFGVKRSIDPISQGYYIDPWWNGNWLKYRTLIISNTYIDNDLVNFTVNVTVNSTIASSCNVWGTDIRFLDIDNTTEYSYEIENWSASGDSQVWVKIPRIESNINTKFLMYYNNTGASDNQDVTGTWNSNYLAVYHMNDTSDSTSPWYNLTNDGANSNTSGRIGQCYDYVLADTDRMYHTTFLDTFPNACTMESWHLRDTDSSTMQVVGKSNLVSQDAMGLQYSTDDLTRIRLGIEGSGQGYQKIYVSGAMPKEKWYYAAGTYEKATAGITYRNATANSGNIISEIRDGTHTDFAIGMTGASYPFDGRIDEVRISDVKRNASWIKVTYHSVATSAFLTWGTEMLSTAPTNFNATTISSTMINLSWTKSASSIYTYIMRKTGSYPTSRTDGTNIYNNTGVTFSDISVSSMTMYYYSAWGYNNSGNIYSPGYAISSNDTSPANPISISSITGAAFINFTWVMGARADNTTIVHKVGSFPSNPQDGSEIYNNSTPLYYNDTTFYSGFYTFYSWNSTYNRFSDGDDIEYGKLTINCYDENTSVAIASWDIFITNEDGSSTYESTGNTNPLIIDPSTIPYGANTVLKINATYYDFRVYYMDIYLNNQYTLDAYLSPANISELYLLYVIDEVDQPISDAKLDIKQYINESEGYKNISIRLTDANGQVAVYLIPGSWNSLYKIIISKSGYVTETVDLIPRDIVYAGDWEYIFRLELEEEEYENETTYNEAITFEGYVSDAGYVYVNYTDSLNETTSTNICIYEHNTTTGNITVFHWDNRTSDNDFTFNVLGNVSNCYEVVMSLVHVTFGTPTDSFIICGEEQPYTNISNQTWVDALFDANYGTNPFGWSNFFGFFILLAGVFSFGQKNTGVSLIVTGGILIFINTVIGWTIGGAVIPVLFIILGVLVQWANHRREVTG